MVPASALVTSKPVSNSMPRSWMALATRRRAVAGKAASGSSAASTTVHANPVQCSMANASSTPPAPAPTIVTCRSPSTSSTSSRHTGKNRPIGLTGVTNDDA